MASRSIFAKMISALFHKIYYKAMAKEDFPTYWGGIHTQKYPGDLIVYQEILFDTKPDVIIECGTNHGGSALFLASICDMIGKGRVITVDIEDKPRRPIHSRISYLHGSSVSDEVIHKLKTSISSNESAMVILDSNHQYDHVLNELQRYAGFVTSGQYLIVEDTNINGHPVRPSYGPGPMEAVRQFLKETDEFEIDHSREKYLITFNPDGYLRKK